jgi:hypothetical protein
MSHRIEVPCLVDIEQTADSLHAHAIPEGIDLHPGDRVLVHGAPSRVAYGEYVRIYSMATVIRAGVIRRAWTRMTAVFELLELFETGFQPKEHA